MRLLQFLFSLALIVGAFAVGVFAGWYRWGPRGSRTTREPEDSGHPTADERPWADTPNAPRSTLFSPEGETWSGDRLPVTISGRSPRTVVLPAELAIDLRARGRASRGELGTGSHQIPSIADDTP